MQISAGTEIEHIYTGVLDAIGKALEAGDIERATAMAKRGAAGRPKVINDPNQAALPMAETTEVT
jgi:hypothetical protein